MTRLIAIACFGALFSLSTACGGSDKKKDEPAVTAPVETQPTMSDAEALIGTWSDGASQLTFGANKSYRWKTSLPCRTPPCPSSETTGTWILRGGKIYLDPSEGGDEVLGYTIGWNPRKLDVSSNKQGKSWKLNFAN